MDALPLPARSTSAATVCDFEPIARSAESLVHDAAASVPAPQDQTSRDPMHDHIALVHAEVEE